MAHIFVEEALGLPVKGRPDLETYAAALRISFLTSKERWEGQDPTRRGETVPIYEYTCDSCGP